VLLMANKQTNERRHSEEKVVAAVIISGELLGLELGQSREALVRRRCASEDGDAAGGWKSKTFT
jgi:hypothetical protein